MKFESNMFGNMNFGQDKQEQPDNKARAHVGPKPSAFMGMGPSVIFEGTGVIREVPYTKEADSIPMGPIDKLHPMIGWIALTYNPETMEILDEYK